MAAWNSIRLCCDLSKEGINLATKNIGDADMMRGVDTILFISSFLSTRQLKKSFSSRFYQSMEHIAALYSRLGDNKKAKGYIIASAESSNLLPRDSFRKGRPTLHDIIEWLNEKSSNIHHLRLRTTMTNIFSLSMPPESFDDQVSQLLRTLTREPSTLSGLFITSDKMNLPISQMDWLREALNYILLRK